jgi:tetratricopeptide (TPR) repeat protein
MRVEEAPAEIPDTLRHATALHQAGRLDEAERLYRQVLQAAPDQADALHALGVPMAQTGRPLEAAGLIDRAILVDPVLLGGIKARLGRNRDGFALFDTPRFTRYIEEGYRIMWERAERGLPPASFAAESRRR